MNQFRMFFAQTSTWPPTHAPKVMHMHMDMEAKQPTPYQKSWWIKG